MEILNLSIKEIHKGLIEKKFSAKEVVEVFLERIERQNSKLNAFLEVFSKEAKEEAEKIDKAILSGEKISLLGGIPCAIKDNILVKGKRCTAGSKILENYIATYDATVVKKLKKEGAIILGKTNMDEFAMGSSGEHSAFGETKNPNNLEYVPGGSSSGSAAAVSAKMCVFALGSDTGGSVRQPASFCGIVGLKPTYGAVSRFGLIAMASSLDQIGLFARNVEDTEIVFLAIKGKDKRDATSWEKEEEKEIPPTKMRIGIPRECFGQGIQKEVIEGFKEAVFLLEKEKIQIEEIEIPSLQYGVACYYIVMPSEVSSNLARYDGIKYGKSREEAENLMELYCKTRAEFLGEEVKRRIMLGTYCLSAGYYEAYYLRAQKVRTKIANDFKETFQKVDLILTSTSPTLSFKFKEKLEDPLSMYMADYLTVPVNLAGLPAISLPFKEINNLPFGVQAIAPPFCEKKLFNFGKFFEKLC
ncbi:MAG: Asp-tRNA(Asn)/Glu-tRNA(Gln) amidotransferase subunit GatA [Candidatus Pacebacteria bacterium]|nr:Asp-tRNA(Asn)/Glu-tRNA(Gln) amidotransferase subunit GatA [Candidatus Paceibacterota bacterium]